MAEAAEEERLPAQRMYLSPLEAQLRIRSARGQRPRYTAYAMKHGLMARLLLRQQYLQRMEKRQMEETGGLEERLLIQQGLLYLQEARETLEALALSQEQEEEERQAQWAQVRWQARVRVGKTMAREAEARLEELRQAEV